MSRSIYTQADEAILLVIRSFLDGVYPEEYVVSVATLRDTLRNRFPNCAVSDKALAEIIGHEAISRGFNIHFDVHEKADARPGPISRIVRALGNSRRLSVRACSGTPFDELPTDKTPH